MSNIIFNQNNANLREVLTNYVFEKIEVFGKKFEKCINTITIKDLIDLYSSSLVIGIGSKDLRSNSKFLLYLSFSSDLTYSGREIEDIEVKFQKITNTTNLTIKRSYRNLEIKVNQKERITNIHLSFSILKWLTKKYSKLGILYHDDLKDYINNLTIREFISLLINFLTDLFETYNQTFSFTKEEQEEYLKVSINLLGEYLKELKDIFSSKLNKVCSEINK